MSPPAKPGAAGIAASPVRAEPPVPASAAGTAADDRRRWRSAELFGAAQEIEIEHGQAVYRLRLTALGKLILTK